MPNVTLEKRFKQAASDFAAQIAEAIKSMTLEELISLHLSVPPKKRSPRPWQKRKKPGPKPGAKRKKPGPKPGARRKRPGPEAAATRKKTRSKTQPRKGAAAGVKKARATEKQNMVRDILAYLKVYPDSTCQKIARHVSKTTKAVSAVLRQLRKEGKIASEGKAQNTNYSLA